MPDKIKVDWLVIIFFKAEWRFEVDTKEIDKQFKSIKYTQNTKILRLYETPTDETVKIFNSKLEELEKVWWTTKWKEIKMEFSKDESSYEKWEKVLSYVFDTYTAKRKAIFVYSHAKGLSIQKISPKPVFSEVAKKDTNFKNEILTNENRKQKSSNSFTFKKTYYDFLQEQQEINFFEKGTIPEYVCEKVIRFHVLKMAQLLNQYIPEKLDILMTNACFTQMYENCYALRDSVKVFIAPPTLIDYSYFHLDEFISIINDNTDQSIIHISKKIIYKTQELYKVDKKEIFVDRAITAIDISKIENINLYLNIFLDVYFVENNFASIKSISDNWNNLFRNEVATVDFLKLLSKLNEKQGNKYDELFNRTKDCIIASFQGKTTPESENKLIQFGIHFPSNLIAFLTKVDDDANFCSLIQFSDKYGENFKWVDKMFEYLNWQIKQ